jgi:hypothetical protein
MNEINQSILTLILLAPLAGAVLVALAPDRAKLPNWIALLTTLATFVLTLHLPAHFNLGQSGFQFEVNRLWVESPKIFYHVGVDGLSMWLVVLVGLLAPVGVVASWNVIKERRKLFFALFLVQQTAMLGVFISLDLMVYYGFWELSLVPMAILIAMYGRKDGPKAALKFFLFTFIPSAPLLVAILWLYAKTGSFDFSTLQLWVASGALPAGALTWVALAFLFAFAVKVPVFPLHGWVADTFSEAPVALAMVVAGRGSGAGGSGGRRHSLRGLDGAGAARLLAADGLCNPEPFELHNAGDLRSHDNRLGRRSLPDVEPWRRGRRAVPAAGLSLRPLRNEPDQRLWRAGRKTAAHSHLLRHRRPGHDRTADAQRLCRRVHDSIEQLCRRQPRLDDCRHTGGGAGRELYALAGAAALLRA